MEYNGEGIEALVAVIEQMKRDSIIFVDKKVKSLLKLLAYYDEFKRVLTIVSRHFNYFEEKRKALITVNGRDFFRAPGGDKELVAFVFNLLLEFDERTEDIISFSCKYYPSASQQESVNKFVNEVMDPFKMSLANLVVNGIEEDNFAEDGRTVAFASNGIYEQTEDIILSMVNEISAASMTEADRDDLLLMLEGLANALDSRDILMIRAIWCGLKKELERKSLCKVQIVKIEEQMKLYLVLK